MKIVIYGVSRSGKDYLLERVVAHLNSHHISAIHIKGSKTLNELSNQLYGINLKQTDEKKRTVLRQKFIDIVDEYSKSHDVVFVDGHYAFIDVDSMKFNTVLTDEDKYCYDHFFYLDMQTEKILEFSRKDPRRKQDLIIQADEIDKWKRFEIEGLSRVCDELGKELVILDENTQNCVQFITYWIRNFHHCFDYPNIAKQLVGEFLENNHKKYTDVILLDCDNTLSLNDTTYDFCNVLGIDKSLLKQIFARDRYSSYQFFQIQNLYQNFDNISIKKASEYAVSQIQMSDEICHFIEYSKTKALILALTSGVSDIWENKISKLDNIDKVWGNAIHSTQLFFVTPLLKKHIALAFKESGIKVIAIGDSMIDIPMLEVADVGYIVAHKKLNQAVCRYFANFPHSSINQIFATTWKYPVKQISYKD